MINIKIFFFKFSVPNLYIVKYLIDIVDRSLNPFIIYLDKHRANHFIDEEGSTNGRKETVGEEGLVDGRTFPERIDCCCKQRQQG